MAVSVISTRKVDSPFARLSDAPTRQKIRSTIPSFALAAGTYEPVWASKAISAFCRKYVLLPAILGPVINAKDGKASSSALNKESLGTNSPVGKCLSTTGWRPSFISKIVESSISGRTQLLFMAACAKDALTSVFAISSAICKRYIICWWSEVLISTKRSRSSSRIFVEDSLSCCSSSWSRSVV